MLFLLNGLSGVATARCHVGRQFVLVVAGLSGLNLIGLLVGKLTLVDLHFYIYFLIFRLLINIINLLNF